MKYIRIKSWDEFQQYKDRDPKWIKLYRSLLDHYEFTHLSDAQKFHWVGLLLLAAKLDNKIPADEKWIATRMSASTKVDLKPLFDADFIELYDSVQNCTELYESVPREEESREEKKREDGDPIATALANELLERTEAAIGRKLVSTVSSSKKHIQKLIKKGISEADIRKAITFLVTTNLKGDYPLEVQSGKSLHEKWDKIQAAISRTKRNEPTESRWISPGGEGVVD